MKARGGSLCTVFELWYRVEMHVYIPSFQGQLINKKKLMYWVLGRVEKISKKGWETVKNQIFCFRQKISISDTYICLFLHSFFKSF